jgi:hypothetical protein
VLVNQTAPTLYRNVRRFVIRVAAATFVILISSFGLPCSGGCVLLPEL